MPSADILSGVNAGTMRENSRQGKATFYRSEPQMNKKSRIDLLTRIICPAPRAAITGNTPAFVKPKPAATIKNLTM